MTRSSRLIRWNSFFAFLLAGLAPGTASAEAPGTGLFIEARLSSLNLPGANGVIGGLGGPAPATVGYRASGFTVGIGPAIHQLTQSRTSCIRDPMSGNCSGDDETRTDTLNAIGAHLVATVTLATLHEERAELYVLVGFTIGAAFTSSDDGNDTPPPEQDLKGSPIAFGGTVGVGIRYFLAPFLGIGAELGEGYTNIPLSSTTVSSERIYAFSTWGALSAQLVF
jgi:hypothetical protein